METIRIRLTKEQKQKLTDIAARDHRSITGVIRNWIDNDDKTDGRAHELFHNKEYLQ